MDKESVTDQSPRCKVTARVKFLDIPIAPLQGGTYGCEFNRGRRRPALRDGLCPRLLYVTPLGGVQWESLRTEKKTNLSGTETAARQSRNQNRSRPRSRSRARQRPRPRLRAQKIPSP